MTTTLITGATGFVGSACLRQLPGGEFHACARSVTADVADGVTFHTVDLRDADATLTLIAELRPARLLHLAWIATGAYRDSDENDDWLAASRRLLEAFVDNGGRRVVVAGTCAEYDWATAGPYRERDSPIRPTTSYGRAKDELRRSLEQTRGVSAAWARLFFLYGPDEHPDRFVPSVTRALLAGRAADCTAGTQVRDFLHVDDAARALLALLASDVEGPVNVASGEGVAVRSVAELVAASAGSPGLLRIGARPMPTDEPDEIVADVTRLRREVGFRPERTLEQGLAETVDWWRERARAA